MGFFADIVAAATPWSTAEAEAVSGGTGTDSTPAQPADKSEGESTDASDKENDEEVSEEKEDEEEEEEEEEEMVDPQEQITEECKESSSCRPAKHHFDECVERVTAAADDEDHKGPKEDCVEEFFHLAHCANACAAPKLWAALK